MVRLLIVILTFTSCAQRIKVPINRFHTPETIGLGLELESRQGGFSSGVFDFSNNQTDNPLVLGTVTDQELYLGLGVSNNVDFFLRVPKESSSLLGLKLQLLGTPKKARSGGHQLAFTMGMGAERDKFEDDLTIDLKSDVQDYSLIHGYRFNNMFLLYEGFSISSYSFEGIVSGDDNLESNKLDYNAKDILNIFIGGEFGGESFNLKLELAGQRIKWTNTEEKTFVSFGYTLVGRF